MNFEQTKKCYEKGILDEKWGDLVQLVREEHHRKSSFMPGFERGVAGESTTGPSFAERARRQWAKRSR
jgi:hypothetical protein